MENVVEEQSIFWADDVDFANIMVLRTLANMKVSQDEVPLLPEYKNEDDKAFVKELFRHTLVHYKEYFDYIGRFTKNWDVERIAFMDNLIMAATMSELINFPSIPVKVTLDEFIEMLSITARRAAVRSINGILDKVVRRFAKRGRLQKAAAVC